MLLTAEREIRTGDPTTACSHGQEIAFLLGDMHFLINSIFIWKMNEYFSTAVYLRTGYCGNREVKIPRFRCTCTGSMILVSNIFVDVCTFTRN